MSLSVFKDGLSGYSVRRYFSSGKTLFKAQKYNFTVIINDLDNLQLIKSLRTDIRKPFKRTELQ